MNHLEHAFPLRQTHIPDTDSVWNWAQNATLGARANIRRPSNEGELRAMVADATGAVRIIGSRLSAGNLLCADQPQDILLDASQLRGLIASSADTVTFAAATPLHEVYQQLTEMGRMLPSSPGVIALQTLAGAIGTGTHGQGLNQSSIADEVLSMRIIQADGGILDINREHPWFGAAQLALGAIGVITEVTLRTVPAALYTCVKSASSADGLDTLLYHWNQDYPLSKAWWFPEEDKVHVWTAREANDEETRLYRDNHRQTVTLSRGNQAMNATVDRTLGHMHYPIILRCTGPSSAWLSPAFGEATCFFGFVVYYAEDGTLSQQGVRFLHDVETLLADEGGRPHWGKYYNPRLYHWRDIYPRWEQFREVKARLDPKGKFANTLINDIFK